MYGAILHVENEGGATIGASPDGATVRCPRTDSARSLTPAMCSTEASLLSLPNSGKTVDQGVFSGSSSRLDGHI